MKKVMMLLRSTIVILCFFLVMAGNANAALVVDQYNIKNGWIGAYPLDGYTEDAVGQLFTPSQSNLAAVDVWLGQGGSVYLNIRENWIDGDIICTTESLSGTDDYVTFDIDPDVWLTVENSYVIEVVWSSGETKVRKDNSGDDYYTRGGFLSNGGYSSGCDMLFRTYYDDEASPVPVPAAVWLLGSGLAGLIGIRRRRSC